MFNAVKMDIYKMLHMKSFYVILIITAVVTFLTTAMSAAELKQMEKQPEIEVSEEAQEEEMNLGISVAMPTQPGHKMTVLDMFYANANAKALALSIVIFAVLFATADMNNGYIKNIGGQVVHRSQLILSKVMAMLVFNGVYMLMFLLSQALANQMFLGYIKWGGPDVLGRYVGLQFLLHAALSMISMMIAVLLRNNLVSMIIMICLCMNMNMILYSAVDKVIRHFGADNFQLMKYTVTGKISLLSMNPGSGESVTAIVLSLAFLAGATVLSCLLFEKRDIV